MKCAHCLQSFTVQVKRDESIVREILLGGDKDGLWRLVQVPCPACSRFILTLERAPLGYTYPSFYAANTWLVWPRGIARVPLPPEVPEKFAEDYKEACLILADSPKASAALSRRCLQLLLREMTQVKPSDLSKEIEEVIKSGTLPSHLVSAVDAIRAIGNFGAHPI